MAVPRSTRWELQPHTAIKHAILRRYLQAWLPIMARTHGRIVFIDGFAGPGRYTKGEPGSPIIALETLLDHEDFRSPPSERKVTFLFIEEKQDRAEALKREIRDLEITATWVHCEVLVGDFVEHITRILDEIDVGGGRLAPTFAFIDPFGFSSVPLKVISRIVHHEKCECLISFMYESVNRFLGHPEEAIQANFDALFGTTEWRALLELGDPDQRRDQIVALYRQQLKSVAGLRYVRTFEMLNEGNRTEYFLFFGTNGPRGLTKMKEAMWDADPIGGQVFSDRSNPHQAVLFQHGAENDLVPLLRSQFADQGWVGIEELERFVLEDTPFSETRHLKRKALGRLETDHLIEVRRPAGKRNRIGEYPNGTLIQFLGTPKEPDQGRLFG